MDIPKLYINIHIRAKDNPIWDMVNKKHNLYRDIDILYWDNYIPIQVIYIKW